MSGTTDSMIVLQWVGVLLPTASVVALFIRLGSFLQTVKSLKDDTIEMAGALESVQSLTIELRAWRDASRGTHDDLLARVRRLEDMSLGRDAPTRRGS